MPQDPISGMWFGVVRDADGRLVRDWTYDRNGLVQVDERWKTGDFIAGPVIAMFDDDAEPVTVQ
jgi:hypothetical protein